MRGADYSGFIPNKIALAISEQIIIIAKIGSNSPSEITADMPPTIAPTTKINVVLSDEAAPAFLSK